uniref:RES domain-containing protein n=1 Tax=Cupriavidus taiwanensis TaxID=164546 RepID=UPI003F495579
MPTPTFTVPPEIAHTLPSLNRLRQALAPTMTTLPAGTRLFRAAWHPDAVIPPYVQRTYRFGPPAAMVGADGRYPVFWMYAAHDLNTALWEAGFCANDVTQPGTFYIPSDAVRVGWIATFLLQADVRILDLDGTVLSKLGIYDRIHEGDYDWCQCFGLRMFDVLASFASAGAPVGFRYPSRKHKSHQALAIQSASLDQWRRLVDVQVVRFAEMPEFKALGKDPNYADPLAGSFSLD